MAFLSLLAPFGLRVRILLIVALVLLPAIVTILFNAAEQRKNLIDKAGQDVQGIVRIAAEQHREAMGTLRATLLALSRLPAFQSIEFEPCNRLLGEVLRATNAEARVFTGIALAEPKGQLLCRAPDASVLANVADRDYFQRAIERRDFQLSSIITSRATGQPVIAAAQPILDKAGSVAAVIIATADLEWITSALVPILPEEGVLTVFDKRGTVILRHPDRERLVGTSQPDVPLVRVAAESGTPLGETVGFDGVPRFYAVSRIAASDVPVNIAVGVPIAQTYAAADAQTIRLLLVLLVVGSAAVALAWWFGGELVVHPLQELVSVTDRLARGDMSARASVDSNPEIGRLSAAFNAMAGLLQERQAENQRILETLRATNETLGATLRASPLAIITINQSGSIVVWSEAAEGMFGDAAGDPVGRSFRDVLNVIAGGDGTSGEDVLTAVLAGEPVDAALLTVRVKDGKAIMVSFSGRPLYQESGTLRGAVFVFDDVTQRRKVASQLQQAQKMEAIGQLTGGIAHDFNNILGIVIGNLDLLEEVVGKEAGTRSLIEAATAAALRGAELTRSLLAFARNQPLQPARIDVHRQLTTVFGMLKRTLGEAIRIDVKAPQTLWPIMIDPAQFESAIANLSINARDAMPNGGILVVNGRNATLGSDHADGEEIVPGDYVVLEISDNGCGMPADVQAKVFEPFFTTKAIGKGSGLGLSMVYGFMKQSQGHIKIYSEEGFGTTVRLYFPRADRDGSDAAVSQPQGRPSPRGKERILVVEDNPAMRGIVVSQLTSLGYGVVEAEHAPAALAILDDGQPIDLIFTDIVMPEGLSGYDLAQAASDRRPGVKVLFTSGFPGDVLRKPEFDGATDLLSKPYRKDELASKVREILDRTP